MKHRRCHATGRKVLTVDRFRQESISPTVDDDAPRETGNAAARVYTDTRVGKIRAGMFRHQGSSSITTVSMDSARGASNAPHTRQCVIAGPPRTLTSDVISSEQGARTSPATARPRAAHRRGRRGPTANGMTRATIHDRRTANLEARIMKHAGSRTHARATTHGPEPAARAQRGRPVARTRRAAGCPRASRVEDASPCQPDGAMGARTLRGRSASVIQPPITHRDVTAPRCHVRRGCETAPVRAGLGHNQDRISQHLRRSGSNLQRPPHPARRRRRSRKAAASPLNGGEGTNHNERE